MELRDGMFAVKLCELEHQYGLLRSRLELCQGADHEKIRHLLADVLDDYRENALLLEQSAEGCRSPAVAELAGVQRDYSKRMEELLRDRLPRLMHGEEDPQEERAEAAALFAEYAIDFAAQGVRSALLAALAAMEEKRRPLYKAAADICIPNNTDVFRRAAKAAEEALHAYFGT